MKYYLVSLPSGRQKDIENHTSRNLTMIKAEDCNDAQRVAVRLFGQDGYSMVYGFQEWESLKEHFPDGVVTGNATAPEILEAFALCLPSSTMPPLQQSHRFQPDL